MIRFDKIRRKGDEERGSEKLFEEKRLGRIRKKMEKDKKND